MKTLEIVDTEEYNAVSLVADFGTLVGTYQAGFSLIVAQVKVLDKEATVDDAPAPSPVGIGPMELVRDSTGRLVGRTTLGSGSYNFVVRIA